MPEFHGLHSYNGMPLTLVGDEVAVGDNAPDFSVISTAMESVSLSSARGQVVVLSVAPSVDTGVCAKQLRTFNEAAAGLGEDVLIWNISRDLPFANKRFCGAESIERAQALSDYNTREFGERYGLHIKENALLARSVWVIDRKGVVTHKQISPELPQEVDFETALAAARAAL